jgi:hypothetical protein
MARAAWSLASNRSSGDNFRKIATNPSSTSQGSLISGLLVMGNQFPLASMEIFGKNG